MLRISSFLTGEDYSMLRNSTPLSKKKVHSLATVLLLPVIMWFATGFMLVSNVLGFGIATAIGVALFISLVIFLIERNIIMASGRGLIIMRILIGLITALLGSIALDEVIFEHDIEQQLVLNKEEMIKNRMIQADSLYASDINNLRQEVESKKVVWYDALKKARQEADGTGGSGHVGVSAITRMKLGQADELKKNYLAASDELNILVAKRDNEKHEITLNIEESFSSHALLLRIKALFDLVKADQYMLIVYILFTAFLFFIEFAVVLMKLGWKKTHYERKLLAMEIIGEKRLAKIIDKDNNYYDASTAHPHFSSTRRKLQKVGTVGLF